MARTKGAENKVNFFSEVDFKIDKNGKKYIASEYPMWFNPEAIEDIREDLRRDEFVISNGLAPEGSLPEIRARLKKSKEKLDAIEGSLPKMSGKQKDEMMSALDALGKEISDRMFTRTQEARGTSDAYQEARRMTEPTITVTPEIHKLLEACNVKPVNGKVSRDMASKAWKIARKANDMLADVEELRRD